MPVFVAADCFVVVKRLAAPHALEDLRFFVHPVRGKEGRHGFSDNFLGGISE
jgi:hypothetical protein